MAAIRNLQTQGSFTNTGNTFDLGIQGRGWFQLTDPNGDTVYTRAGAFNTNASGQLVSLDGYAVSPSIIVPPNSTNVTISSTSGIVTATVNGATTPTSARPAHPRQFRQRDRPRGTSAPTCSARPPPPGTAVVGVPGDPSVGTISQGYLEASNVDPVKEISDLISAQRAYEMNSKVIQACDQMGSTLTHRHPRVTRDVAASRFAPRRRGALGPARRSCGAAGLLGGPGRGRPVRARAGRGHLPRRRHPRRHADRG